MNSLTNIGIVTFSVFTFNNFRKLIFASKLSIVWSCQMYHHKIIFNIPLITLLMSVGYIQMSSNLCFSVFLDQSPCGIINFINTLKNQLLFLLVFSILPVFYSIEFCSFLYCFLLLLFLFCKNNNSISF